MTYPTAGNSGPTGQGFNHAAPPSADRAHPSQAVSHRWASVEPSPTGRPKTTKFTPAVGGAYPYMPNRSLRASRPPRPASQLLLGPSSRQISNTYLGGILVWRLSYALLLFGGTLGSGPSRAQSPPPGQHAYNVLPYSPNTHYVYRASRCKCEIVKLSLETKFIN